MALITPPLIYGARHQTRPTSLPERTTRTRVPDPEAERRAEALMDFGRWSDYVADDPPPVLFVRVTPRLVEGFWRMVARGAAQTQGMSLPPMKHFKAGFARMQAFCGDTQMTPIHPFVLERAISQTDTIDEGLYRVRSQCPHPRLWLGETRPLLAAVAREGRDARRGRQAAPAGLARLRPVSRAAVSLRAGASKATVARLTACSVQVRTKDWRFIWLHFIADALASWYIEGTAGNHAGSGAGPQELDSVDF